MNQFNHTMIRVKDPKVSLAFYQDVIRILVMSIGSSVNYFLKQILGMDLLSGTQFDLVKTALICHL